MDGFSFTVGARTSLALARDEAARLQHEYVGTEHLLLGLLRRDEGGAIAVLRELAFDVDAARATIEATVKHGRAPIAADRTLPYTSRAKVVLDLATTAVRELATDDARQVGQFGIGSEHLLLGMLREGKGIAAQVLIDRGVSEAAVRETILRLAATKPTRRRRPVVNVQLPSSSGQLTPLPVMGYNFTENVRRVLAHAREEAVRLHHESVGTEHLLLGLLKRGEGVGFSVLEALNVDVDRLKEDVERTVKQGDAVEHSGPDLPYTSRAKKVLELAMAEARELVHAYVGSEHLLLGLIREEKGIAAQVLASAGVTLDQARSEVIEIVGGPAPEPERKPGEPRIPKVEPPTLVTVELHYERGWMRRREFRTVGEARAFLAQL